MNESESLKVGIAGCEITGGLYESTDEDPDFIEKASPFLDIGRGVDDVGFSESLSDQQVCQLKDLILEFSDIHNKNRSCPYSVKLKSDEPVHKKPYPVSYALRKRMLQEIDSMMV